MWARESINRNFGNALMLYPEVSAFVKRSHTPQDVVGGRSKRIFDLLVASVTFIAFLPIFFTVAILVKLTDPGPIIFRHVRVGLDGRRFQCLKFRSMAVNSEELLTAFLDSNPEARQEWERMRKLTRDPRITPLGKFLRQSSLDELPQLINVIRGEMSLVGPRPIVSSELKRYGDKLGLYLMSRPGITGVWQVNGRSDCKYDERVEMDAEYVRNWRISTDFAILLRTLEAVLLRKGSY